MNNTQIPDFSFLSDEIELTLEGEILHHERCARRLADSIESLSRQAVPSTVSSLLNQAAAAMRAVPCEKLREAASILGRTVDLSEPPRAGMEADFIPEDSCDDMRQGQAEGMRQILERAKTT